MLRDGRETCTLDEFKRYLAPYVVRNPQEGSRARRATPRARAAEQQRLNRRGAREAWAASEA